MYILSMLTFFQNNPKETIKFGFGENIKGNGSIEKQNKNENESKKLMFKKALFSKRTLKLFLMLFLFFPTIRFINYTWRPIGIYYKIRTDYLQLIGTLFSIT